MTRLRAAWVYGAGVCAVLIGAILPWLRGSTGWIWAWDVGLLWAVTGAVPHVRIPPSLGAVTLVVGLLLAVPLLRGVAPKGPAVSAAAGVVVGLGGLSILRALLLRPSLSPRLGLIVCVAGGVAAAVGAWWGAREDDPLRPHILVARDRRGERADGLRPAGSTPKVP